jgi:hypothetical protein
MLSIPFALLLGVAVYFMVKKGGLKLSQALVCIVLGLFLASNAIGTAMKSGFISLVGMGISAASKAAGI